MKIDELLAQAPQLPHWNELPDLALYMDQVVSLGNRYLEPIVSSSITSSMVNSYVKKGLMPKPVKKKYSQKHVASLILITIMKQVYSLDDIHNWLENDVQNNYQEAYDTFCNIFNAAFGSIDLNHFDLNLHFDETKHSELALHLIVETIIFKIISEHLINEIGANDDK